VTRPRGERGARGGGRQRPGQSPRRRSGRPIALIAGVAVVAALAFAWVQSRPGPSVPVSATRLAPAPVAGYTVVATYPHDPGAFTQGLIYRDGVLYESTGLNGRSSVRQVRLETGDVIRQHDVDAAYFGEGLADWGDRLVQLTWQSHIGFVYDLATFAPIRSFTYPGEGWGLTEDGQRLILSDGTPALRFLDPTTFVEIGRVTVTDAGRPIVNLNELEMVRGELYANVWQSDRIVRIDPDSGHVLGWIDLSGLLAPADRTQPVDVLNGIAYDEAGDRLFVTGKLWPKLFQIRVVER